MRLYEIMRVAVSGMRGNPLRSILTVLGVVIGVTAVILMISLGEGAKRQVTARIQGLGSNLLIINPGRGGSRTTGFGSWGSGMGFNTDLVDYLQQNCVLCKAVAPEAAVNQTVKYSSISLQTSIVGITPDYMDVRNFTIARGEPISTFDVEDRRRVAVLGSTVASELFEEADPLGKVVRIGTQRFTVIGVLASKGQSGFTNIDDQILVPLSTLQRRLSRNERLRAIYVEVIDAKSMAPALEEVKALLFERFGNEDAYFVNSQAEILETMESTAGTFTLLLAGIAGVSLLVGGIGIMNIMLVSVTERIREIGIRKALGAKRWEILTQFLFEAISLSVLGGILGILCGIGGSKLVSKYAGWNTAVAPESILVAFGFSAAVGLFFGVYPASKASQLQPVEALRHD